MFGVRLQVPGGHARLQAEMRDKNAGLPRGVWDPASSLSGRSKSCLRCHVM